MPVTRVSYNCVNSLFHSIFHSTVPFYIPVQRLQISFWKCCLEPWPTSCMCDFELAVIQGSQMLWVKAATTTSCKISSMKFNYLGLLKKTQLWSSLCRRWKQLHCVLLFNDQVLILWAVDFVRVDHVTLFLWSTMSFTLYAEFKVLPIWRRCKSFFRWGPKMFLEIRSCR